MPSDVRAVRCDSVRDPTERRCAAAGARVRITSGQRVHTMGLGGARTA